MRSGISTEWTDVNRLRDLCLRWNRAAADAGYAGSEYIDDPDRVFSRVIESHRTLIKALVKEKKAALSRK